MNNISEQKIATTNIQRTYRGYKSRQLIKNQHKAAVTIQTAYLCHQQDYNKDQIIKAVKAVNANETCPISFEPIRAKNIFITDCLHIFDKGALAQWVKESASCPTCRDAVQPFMSSESRLLNAASFGDTFTLQKLLSRGVNSQYIDKCGNTALHLAIKNRHVKCAQLLLNYKADLNMKNDDGETALDLAIKNGCIETTRLLLNPDYRADLNNKNNDGDTPIHLAVREGHLDIVRILIDANISLNTKNNRDETPFYSSIFTNNDAISEALIDAGADINMGTANKWRPIHEAAYNGKAQLVQLLINRGGYLERVNNLNQTALHLASKKGHLDIVSALISRYIQLEAKGIVEAKDNDGYTALQLAVINNHPDIIIALANAGADLTVSTTFGLRLLHLAVKNNSLAAAQALINAGVELDSIDINNETALILAKQYGRHDFVQELRSAGAREYSIKNCLVGCSIM